MKIFGEESLSEQTFIVMLKVFNVNVTLVMICLEKTHLNGILGCDLGG